jgi:hypothetical protein
MNNCIENHKTPIEVIRDLLGYDTTLIPCNGKKPAISGWQNLTAKNMLIPSYLKKLDAASNLGVVLGANSGGVCVVDFDVDGEDEKFLKLNPKLSGTLRTRGRRGSSFWIRCIGAFPASTKLDAGEWRADKNQSVISGLHPETRKPYIFVKKVKPIEIRFSEIVWPEGIRFSLLKRTSTSTQNPKLPYHISTRLLNTQDLCYSVTCSNSSEKSIIQACLPSKEHTNHAKLFMLARGIKTLERERKKDLDDEEVVSIFDAWFEKAKIFLRENQPKEKYLEEFLIACDTAERPLDENALAIAWSKVKSSPVPVIASKFRSSPAKLLVALCLQLQLLAGDNMFYLSCYSAAPLIKTSHVHAARLLQKMVRDNILLVVEKGREGYATRYRFVPQPDSQGIAL